MVLLNNLLAARGYAVETLFVLWQLVSTVIVKIFLVVLFTTWAFYIIHLAHTKQQIFTYLEYNPQHFFLPEDLVKTNYYLEFLLPSFLMLFLFRYLFIRKTVNIFLYHLCIILVTLLSFSSPAYDILSGLEESLPKFIALEESGQLQEAKHNSRFSDPFRGDLDYLLGHCNNGHEARIYVEYLQMTKKVLDVTTMNWGLLILAEFVLFLLASMKPSAMKTPAISAKEE
jgi:hypothetical protein